MPPRFAYWTILIDGQPTAFRSREAQELQPTLTQLRRTNKDVVLRWFARGKLWESPEAERAAGRKPKPVEHRGREWRPGGEHKDPRAFWRDNKKQRNQERRAQKHERRQRDGKRSFTKPASAKPASAMRPPYDRKPIARPPKRHRLPPPPADDEKVRKDEPER